MGDRSRGAGVPADGGLVVAMCAGKDCRKRCEAAKIRDSLVDTIRIVDLSCVGICSGPVVVVDPGSDRPIVYSKLRTKRDRALLVRAIAGEARAREKLRVRRVGRRKVRLNVARRLERLAIAG